jgi:hypothetical protein
MDAGTAAVLGALAGSVATIGAALATGWSTRVQAKMAARAEHLRQRRDARQAVYEEFIAAAEAHSDLAKILLAPAPEDFPDFERLRILPPGMDITAVIRESKVLHGKLKKITRRVRLAGPKEVSEAAATVDEKSRGVTASFGVLIVDAGQAGTWTLSEKWNEGCKRFVEFSGAMSDFTERARIALDDDGTKI